MPDLHCHATQVESAARRPRRRGAGGLALAIGAVLAALAGCASGPASLADDRLAYNEVVKVTAEQQMLLNIVRLRYTDTPSSLAISSIATQTERTRSLQLVPFFGVVGGEAQLRGGQALLPGAAISTVDRPTITLTPLDDTEFTRKLFTPMTLDGVLYLAKTTWPISTVFRLWLENLNWVSNAETASGPTSPDVPEFGRFVDGVEALVHGVELAEHVREIAPRLVAEGEFHLLRLAPRFADRRLCTAHARSGLFHLAAVPADLALQTQHLDLGHRTRGQQRLGAAQLVLGNVDRALCGRATCLCLGNLLLALRALLVELVCRQ